MLDQLKNTLRVSVVWPQNRKLATVYAGLEKFNLVNITSNLKASYKSITEPNVIILINCSVHVQCVLVMILDGPWQPKHFGKRKYGKLWIIGHWFKSSKDVFEFLQFLLRNFINENSMSLNVVTRFLVYLVNGLSLKKLVWNSVHWRMLWECWNQQRKQKRFLRGQPFTK